MENCTRYHLCTALGQSCDGCVNYESATLRDQRPVQVVTKCLPPSLLFTKKRKPKGRNKKVKKYVQKMLAKKYWFVEINKKTQK